MINIKFIAKIVNSSLNTAFWEANNKLSWKP